VDSCCAAADEEVLVARVRSNSTRVMTLLHLALAADAAARAAMISRSTNGMMLMCSVCLISS
jgi:hypothetical protein